MKEVAMKKDFRGLGVTFISALILSGCVAYGGPYVPAPPPERVEVIVPAPYPEAVWVPGYWSWNRRHREYRWVPGYWRSGRR